MTRHGKGHPQDGPQKSTESQPHNTTQKEYAQGFTRPRRKLVGEESIRLVWGRGGKISRDAMRWQAKRVLVCAARTPRGFQVLWLRKIDGSVLAELRLRNEPGGCIVLDREGAGSRLGADLVLALESLGAGKKVRIGNLEGGAA